MNKIADMKEVYGKILVELGRKNNKIVVLDSDLAAANNTYMFRKEFPDRFFNTGVAEQNMISLAAGFAVSGLIPIVHSIAVFATGRCFGQIRQHVSYSNQNVKIVGGYAGFTAAQDGASHQSILDIAIMRTLPNMTVLVLADAIEVKKATEAMIDYKGPVYFRLPNGPVPSVYENEDYQFEIGKAVTIRKGNDVTIITCGTMVSIAKDSADLLSAYGINSRVLNMHTIKPIDVEAIIKAARETKAIIIIEEHNKIGGLSSAVSEVLIDNDICIKSHRMGINDCFGESGSPDELRDFHKLNSSEIVKAAKKILKSK